ncbi:MAG: hypothetical protein PHI97_34375, partial [Desulfobulbus sp.]|nr:hypothetical protein [Desulfobulbus sp.]
YPDFMHHKSLHLELTEKLSTKENLLFLTEGNAESEAVINFLGDWFLTHTRNVDRKFAHYLQDRENS